MACAWTDCLDCGFRENNVTVYICKACGSMNVVQEHDNDPRHPMTKLTKILIN